MHNYTDKDKNIATFSVVQLSSMQLLLACCSDVQFQAMVYWSSF